MKCVVVTGMAAVCPVGQSWAEVEQALHNNVSGIQHIAEWDRFDGLNTRLAAPVTNFELPPQYNRKKTRSMGRVAKMATRVSELALEDAGLLDDEEIKSGNTGVAYGSSTGSTDALTDFASMLVNDSMDGVTATTYLRMMPHTTAVNVGVYFGLKGRVFTTSSACTSGSQGIGYAYEAIAHGQQTMMVAGGGEELCPTEAAIFDTLFATSTRNDEPKLTPRPYDVDRDGLVVGEGACTLILEELEHAQARGASIYAEIVGFGTNADGAHVTQPNAETMRIAMELSLRSADLPADAIGYINTHGTATERGDIAETQATATLFGQQIPVSTFKGHVGHTLGACGALEAWQAINMMNSDWYAPSLNLDTVDPRCGELDYIMGSGRKLQNEYVMSNNFAFGGINTSLIFKRWA